MSKNSEVCDICCDNKKKFISCIYCEDKACSSCYENFILDRPNDCCMFCKQDWNFEFIQTNFTKCFVNGEYKKHKKNMLFEREKALFPSTQVEIEKQNKIDKFNDVIKQKREQIKKLKQEIKELHDGLEDYLGNKEKKEEKKEKTLNIFCSAVNCKGFLKNNFICGLCETRHCKHCHVVLEEESKENDEHKCDPDTVETIKTIQKETKPCPKCFAPIFKIEGCDQMWCTECHTTFSWKHGNIETGRVHNPHYWQYLQSQGKDLQAIRMMENGRNGNVIENRCVDLQHAASTVKIKGKLQSDYMEICRIFFHLNYDFIPSIRINNYVISNLDVRSQFMLNEKDEKFFKKTIYAREQKNRFNDDLRQIFRMYHDVGKDILLNVYDSYKNKNLDINKLNESLGEIKELSNYTIEQIEKLLKRFNFKRYISGKHVIEEITKLIP